MKRVEELAVFGGNPVFSEKLHVGRPNIADREALLARINETLDRNWLTNNGPLVQELEDKIARFTGVEHCIAMTNGTVALEIATRGLGLSGEVIIPSFTFIATAHALQWQEITPVFCDIDPNTLCIDAGRVEQLITPRTSGIIAVNVFGQPSNIKDLELIARRRNLKLIFDSAHAFGTSYKGKMIGGFGHAEVFSFHATKFFNTGEGGAILTNDAQLAQKIRLMKNFGFASQDKVIYIGTNGKMSELSAAMGLANLSGLEKILQRNQKNYNNYRKLFSELPGVSLIQYDETEKNNYQYIIAKIDEKITGLHRNTIHKILAEENILVRRYFYPGCHKMEPYKSYFPHAGLLLPVTEKLSEQVLSFPNGLAINESHIQKIYHLLDFILSNAAEIKEKLHLQEGVTLYGELSESA